MEAGSGSQSGIINLTSGSSGTGSQGVITLTFLNDMAAGFSMPAVCVANVSGNTANWNYGATAIISSYSGTQIQLAWENPVGNLTANKIYRLNYVCSPPG